MSGEYRVALKNTAPLRWKAALPLRLYLKHSPLKNGKGLLRKFLISGLMPRNADLDVRLPCGDVITMSSAERIGSYLLIHQYFEDAELAACERFVAPGSTVMDVGANVGIFTMTLARLVGDTGTVIAVDPLPRNCARLREHAAMNRHSSVQIVELAVGDKAGVVKLNTALDPAFVSVYSDATSASGSAVIEVQVRPLDEIWRSFGRAPVSFMKVDVEGSELGVLDGGKELLASLRPVLLIEVIDRECMAAIRSRLDPLGYEPMQPPGFQPWNFIFRPQNAGTYR
jgi:FkbM family methyltransferase